LATGLRFISFRDVRGDGIKRLGSHIIQIRYYQVIKPGSPLYLAVSLHPAETLADPDLLRQ